MGIEIPQQRTVLEPRRIYPKRGQVLVDDGLTLDKVAVKFVDDFTVGLHKGNLTHNGGLISEFEAILSRYSEAVVMRTFTEVEYILENDRISGEAISGRKLPDLNNFYLIQFPSPTQRSIDLTNELLALDSVETAYIERKILPPSCEDIDPVIPLYEPQQNYLGDAPDGIDPYYTWGYHPDGNGTSSFWVMDLEWERCVDHEDLYFEEDDVVNGLTTGNRRDMNHGTAVLGEIGACDNEYGMTGIVSDVTLKAADFNSESSPADNIATANSYLLAGEVIWIG